MRALISDVQSAGATLPVTRAGAAALAPALETAGFVVVDPPTMRRHLEAHGSIDDERSFTGSWDDLMIDEYMADGGRYRRRRHAVFAVRGGVVTRRPDAPHYQSRDYNALNGGIARLFAPVRAEVGDGAVLRAAIRLLSATADQVRRATVGWHAEVHQFRIEASAVEAGKPTPEGTHRDGVDFVLILLVGLRNAAEGVTTIAGDAGAPLRHVRLSTPFEAVILDDTRVRHGVSPIVPVSPSQTAVRDALVVTLTADSQLRP